jgi:hypothetical protein
MPGLAQAVVGFGSTCYRWFRSPNEQNTRLNLGLASTAGSDHQTSSVSSNTGASVSSAPCPEFQNVIAVAFATRMQRDSSARAAAQGSTPVHGVVESVDDDERDEEEQPQQRAGDGNA